MQGEEIDALAGLGSLIDDSLGFQATLASNHNFSLYKYAYQRRN